jgi:hypothetical protein
LSFVCEKVAFAQGARCHEKAYEPGRHGHQNSTSPLGARKMEPWFHKSGRSRYAGIHPTFWQYSGEDFGCGCQISHLRRFSLLVWFWEVPHHPCPPFGTFQTTYTGFLGTVALQGLEKLEPYRQTFRVPA